MYSPQFKASNVWAAVQGTPEVKTEAIRFVNAGSKYSRSSFEVVS